MADIDVHGSKVNIGDRSHVFDHEIDEVVVYDEAVAVLLRVPPDEIENRNVVGFDTDGRHQWRIESLSVERDDVLFMHIEATDGTLFADNWMGVRATIDTSNGEIVDTVLTK